MSGQILMPSDAPVEEKESSKWNPLQCNICTEQYKDPCILQCYHSFCTACIENRIEDGKMVCPLCGSVTVVKEGCSLPPPDPLLKFLVESSSTADRVQCANCDQTGHQMFFCNTCTQPLCVTCREDTHRAKMFHTHDVVMITKHSRDIQKQCKIHGEPYILFSTEKKVMLCINCFRDMKVESRSHCVDLETAYKQGCQKLDDTMQSIRDLQNSVRDGILLLRILLEEIESNAEQEKKDIIKLYDTMQEKILETKNSLINEIDSQYDEKLELFKTQLISLTTFLPTLHVHLVTCAAFSSSASKYEFLDFTYVLMKRLTAIIQVQHPLHPSQTSDIVTEYKSKFARCLEPLLFPPRSMSNMTAPTSMASSVAATRYDSSPSTNTMVMSGPRVGGEMTLTPGSTGITRYNQNKKKFKLKLMETPGFFTDHCKEFDDAHRESMKKVEGLKLSMQEVQRDLTLRRSMTKDAAVVKLKTDICLTEDLLDIHQGNVEAKQSALETHWEEALERIAGEQEVYKAQLQDVCRLKSEISTVKTILEKLSSFISSIANVTQRLAPKLSQATNVSEQDNTHAAMLHKITTLQPDSQHRVDAIRTAQEERDIKTANRTNPLDEELIKTKGLLRAPSARKDSSKRNSAEIKADMVSEVECEKMEKGPTDGLKIESEKSSSANELGTANVDLLDVDASKSLDVKTIRALSDDLSETLSLDQNGTENVELKGSLNRNDDTYKGTVDTLDNEVFNESHGDINMSVVIHLDSENNEDLVVNKIQNQKESTRSQKTDKEAENIGADNYCNGNDINGTLAAPDITQQLTVVKLQGNSAAENELDKNQNTELVDMTEELYTSYSESDLDTSVEVSLDSSFSGDDGVKPGLVRDIIAKVDGKVKSVDDKTGASSIKNAKSKVDVMGDKSGKTSTMNGAMNDFDLVSQILNSGSSLSFISKDECKSNHVANATATLNGGTNDRLNKFVSVDKENEIASSQESSADSSPIKSDSSPTKTENGITNEEEDVYVTKSLPELAQVFEPGELKPKKRRAKGEKGKVTKDK